MSFKSVEWAMHMTPTKGRPGDKFVLVTLAWHKNEQTGKCCPSIPLLMSETGMSRDFIRDALKRLTAAGLIKVSRTPGGRTNYLLVEGSNDYRVPTTTGEQLLPGEGSNDYRGRGVTATPNMEVNKELNKEGENPLPPPLAFGEAGGTDTPLLALRDPGCVERENQNSSGIQTSGARCRAHRVRFQRLDDGTQGKALTAH